MYYIEIKSSSAVSSLSSWFEFFLFRDSILIARVSRNHCKFYIKLKGLLSGPDAWVKIGKKSHDPPVSYLLLAFIFNRKRKNKHLQSVTFKISLLIWFQIYNVSYEWSTLYTSQWQIMDLPLYAFILASNIVNTTLFRIFSANEYRNPLMKIISNWRVICGAASLYE